MSSTKKKKILKEIITTICIAIVTLVIVLAISVGRNGMWNRGIPKAEEISSITIEYPSLTEEVKEITDEEKIELSVNMCEYLNYKPFAEVKGEGESLVTICYNLKNGDKVEVSANRTCVFYNGKKRALKKEETFMNIVEGLFFYEETVEE